MALTLEKAEELWQKRWPSWVEKATKKHEGKYAYNSSKRVEVNGRWYINITCPEHGDWLQAPPKHIFGRGCPKCVGRGVDKVEILRNLFPDWDFSGVKVGTVKDDLIIQCPKHGKVRTRYDVIKIREESIETPCPKCNKEIGGFNRRLKEEEVRDKLKEVHGDLITLVSDYTTTSEKHTFRCKLHGEWRTKLQDVIFKASKCPECGKNARYRWQQEVRKLDPQEFLSQARKVHGDKYEYDLDTFDGIKFKMRMICKDHGEFWQIPNNHITGQSGCPSCAISISQGENAIKDYVVSLGYEVETRNRKILRGRELDILIPSENLAIEYCGLYWHGEARKEDKDYHYRKYLGCKSEGIKLLTVFEDEWLDRPEVVKTNIRAKLGLLTKVGARQTKLVNITWTQAKEFLETWHMQGSGSPSKTCIGLEYQGKLVAVAVWGPSRFEEGKFEVYRICFSDITVVGGVGKFTKEMVRACGKGSVLLTYADMRWGCGDSYGKVGFEYIGRTAPNYFWCKGLQRNSRHKFQKHKLGQILEKFDENLSELENCRANGYWRIYDCGSNKWEMTC